MLQQRHSMTETRLQIHIQAVLEVYQQQEIDNVGWINSNGNFTEQLTKMKMQTFYNKRRVQEGYTISQTNGLSESSKTNIIRHHLERARTTRPIVLSQNEKTTEKETVPSRRPYKHLGNWHIIYFIICLKTGRQRKKNGHGKTIIQSFRELAGNIFQLIIRPIPLHIPNDFLILLRGQI